LFVSRFPLPQIFYSLYRLSVSYSSLLHMFPLYTGCLSHVPHYHTLFTLYTGCLIFLINTHVSSLYRLFVSCSSLLHVFPLYTGCLSHVPHYYTCFLFIQVVCLMFLITTHFFTLYTGCLSHVPHYCTFLLFKQVILRLINCTMEVRFASHLDSRHKSCCASVDTWTNFQ